jgi:hypothetical protein
LDLALADLRTQEIAIQEFGIIYRSVKVLSKQGFHYRLLDHLGADASRRSPPSYLATKDCGFFRRRARTCWVNPAALRAPTISSQKAAWSGEWTDLPIPRVADVISRVS